MTIGNSLNTSGEQVDGSVMGGGVLVFFFFGGVHLGLSLVQPQDLPRDAGPDRARAAGARGRGEGHQSRLAALHFAIGQGLRAKGGESEGPCWHFEGHPFQRHWPHVNVSPRVEVGGSCSPFSGEAILSALGRFRQPEHEGPMRDVSRRQNGVWRQCPQWDIGGRQGWHEWVEQERTSKVDAI